MLTFQPADCWRGTGIAVDPSGHEAQGQFLRSVVSYKHLQSGSQPWARLVYVAPHWPMSDMQEQVTEFLGGLTCYALAVPRLSGCQRGSKMV